MPGPRRLGGEAAPDREQVGAITKRMAVLIAEEFERFFAGHGLARPVTADLLARMA